jgi:hypothetical protein
LRLVKSQNETSNGCLGCAASPQKRAEQSRISHQHVLSADTVAAYITLTTRPVVRITLATRPVRITLATWQVRITLATRRTHSGIHETERLQRRGRRDSQPVGHCCAFGHEVRSDGAPDLAVGLDNESRGCERHKVTKIWPVPHCREKHCGVRVVRRGESLVADVHEPPLCLDVPVVEHTLEVVSGLDVVRVDVSAV